MSEVTAIPLSVLIRTFNDSRMIRRVIESALPLGGEIVCVDSGSTDETMAVAASLGARVISNPWPGFGPQRRFGEEQCRYDHIFSLDSDEILTTAMVAEIRGHFLSGTPPPLMVVRKAIVFPHRTEPTPFAFCHEQVLIYDRRVARTLPNPNWDKLEITGKPATVTIGEPLWHYSFRDLHQMIAKANYIAKLAGETQPSRSRAMLVVRLIFEFPYTFLKFYVLRRYFLGGVAGFNTAVITAFGRYARIAMMLERKDAGRAPVTADRVETNRG
jgi:glycosyltransferase involved in cell wall biosynthesis